MSKIQLTNISNEPFEASLYHKEFCLKGGAKCKCKKTTHTHVILPRVTDGQFKEGRTESEDVLVPKTLRVGVKASVEIDEAALCVSYINDAIYKRKVLKMKKMRVRHEEAPVVESSNELNPHVEETPSVQSPPRSRRGRKPKSSQE